ncbi:MAG: DUF4838 domain-containing protein, partial [Kiritimatiellia bacterium]
MKNKSLTGFNFAVFMAFALFVCFASLSASAKSYLVKDGQPKADIVIADKPTRAAKLAANELALHLFKISGAQLAVTNAPGKDVQIHIYVGRSDWTDKAGVAVDDLKKDMYKVVSGDSWLALVGHDNDVQPDESWCKSPADRARIQAEWEKKTGKTWRAMGLSHFKSYNKELDIWEIDEAGSLYAVYDFLRGLGVEWYLPGELGEIIPKTADIVLPDVNKTVKPDVGGRSITFADFFQWGGATNEVLWHFRLGLGAGIAGFGHSMQVILGDPNARTNHPEYFALYNGKRDFYSRGGKPCLSSEGLFSNMLAYARAYFDANPDAPAFSIMPTDGFSVMCQCDLCK